MKYTLIPIVLIALLVGILVSFKSRIPKSTPNFDPKTIDGQARISFATMAANKGITELSLAPNQTISGVYKLTGKAQGYMFEGSFPIVITSPTNEEVWSGIGQIKEGDNWMTADPVSFFAEIDTTKIKNGQYTLVLKQDDPSGEQKNLQQLSISFQISN